MQFNAYTITLFASALVSLCLFAYAWRRRSVTAGTEVALLAVAIMLWAFFQGMEGLVTTRFAKMGWGAATYLGSQAVPVLFFLFSLRYTHQDKWLTTRRIAALWIVPLASITMAFTSGLHHLLWKQVTLTHTTAGGVTAVYTHGPWYWIALVYGYVLVIAGMVFLVRAVVKLPHRFAWQARLLVIAAVVPLLGHIMYSFTPSLVEGLDVTPVTFTISGALFAVAVFRYRFLDLRPLASGVFYDGVGDAMVAVDVDGRVVDVNPAGQSLLGKTSDEAIGRPVPEVLSRLPELAELVEGGAEGDTGEVEIKLNGTRMHYDVRTWPLADHRGHVLGRLLTLHDVTELRLAQEELKRINAELEGYARTVSHDLKNPLTSMSLASEGLDRLLSMPETPRRDEDVHKMLAIILSGSRKAAELTTSLLALAQAGQKPLSVEDVSVDEVVSRVLEENRGLIDERGVRVEALGLGTLRADPTHVYQLFANLIGNALQHNDSPRPRLSVRLTGTEDGLHTFLVRDNGPGIPPDSLERVFEPFFKTGRGGTGIGLSTAERIVKTYGGTIRAYNDDGACFEFSIRDMT